MKQTIEYQLENIFGHTSFKLGQKEIIEDVINGKDVLGILPTGSGKSVCFQLPGLIFGGTTIIVSPLLSLMVDQVKQLKASGIKDVVAINSMLDPVKRAQVLENLYKYRLIYISPEMLQNEFILKRLIKLNIKLFVIDEAHCISQWGHEFRPDYLKIKDIINQLDQPPVLALSATATEEVQNDILAILDRPNMKKHIYPIDRKNISLVVEDLPDRKAKIDYLIALLKQRKIPTMIYFSSRKEAEQITLILREQLDNFSIAYYHGGLEQDERLLIQQQFMKNQLDIICCTSAFGMGINKSDIRLIIHYHLPTQLESFIQEIGRAGRDGEQCISIVLYSKNDVQIPRNLFHSELPSTDITSGFINSLENLQFNTTNEIEKYVYDFQIFNETQWRFIRYHLEDFLIIQKDKLDISSEKLVQFDRFIKVKIEERLKYKHHKLNDLIEWVDHSRCRREKLYQHFQSNYSQVEEFCCDNCGLALEEWHPKENNKFDGTSLGWKERLRWVLLQEKNNESNAERNH
ncbi:RecQ family ATP-dependent DNA helicase [Saliterribacillus persicus]|uniref:ATP-dependent DNA helicase RecQ n=1 Tax=Saliterribacillus persicus TaxID=930114 RepID=A0A368XA98_9BACI|nr:RecQ family ATP-dependent DNA helicase [Saliterribacillus persicus]RCW64883.1 ATP-dependent DNA helicase RecQ [Saliterribacillus persicus]